MPWSCRSYHRRGLERIGRALDRQPHLTTSQSRLLFKGVDGNLLLMLLDAADRLFFGICL
jgi:hypothetical protein